MKILKWISDNILFLVVLFLLVFIPLYPKKPLVDIVNTWVYIRAEDFVVLAVFLIWGILLVRRKVTLKTPLTIPILLFWIVGVLSTVHGVLLIFPELANTFPNVAFLSMLRRIEYISLFFVAYASIKDKRFLPSIVAIVAVTLLGVVFYGIGQKYFGFPAYLTMNEEFAKGAPIQLSALSRVPSTFAGHYDLAAYLVLVIPLLASMVFGFRNWFIKLALLATVASGFVLLFMTVSRVSFFVLLLSLAGVFFFHKKKWVIFSLPVVGIFLVFLFFTFSSSLSERFGNTVKEVDVLVDAQTGEALGNIKEISPADFRGKIIKNRVFRSRDDIDAKTSTQEEDLQLGTLYTETYLQQLMNVSLEDAYLATASGIVPYSVLPPRGMQLVPPNASTGENLPQGTGYINLSLSPVSKYLGEFFYEKKTDDGVSTRAAVVMFSGHFLVKKAAAYDLSLTTRYQGEWPNAIEAFKRNIFFGSGYSSISLAIDNSYLRMLGEVGFFGFASFLIIFITAGIYIKKGLQSVDSPIARAFVVGFAAGVFGLILNATLIDVFEASKVAFYLWILMGITMGIIHLYQTKQFVLYHELKKVATSNYAIVVYLGIVTFVMYYPMLSNYFVGDDFTWLRWAAQGSWQHIFQYFTQADGFFYRPGTKLYYLLMYSVFWLNPVAYHVVSLVLHFIVVTLVFLLAKKVLRDFILAALAAFLFAIMSGYHEAIFWSSSVGHLFSVMFVLLSLLVFIYWEEKKNIVYLGISIISIAASLLFHELGVVAPLLILFYKFIMEGSFVTQVKQKKGYYASLFLPIVVYLIVRFLANSHWSGGDYSYNLFKLPFNAVGNFIGYFMLSLFGPLSLSFYDALRSMLKGNLLLSIFAMLFMVGCIVGLYPLRKKFGKEEQRIGLFGIGFMIISLLPFLGLGNITSRYNYLVAFGFVILFVMLTKKLYTALVSSGRDIAIGFTTLALGLFFLFHIIQAQQIQSDWREAGIKVNNFFISIESLYSDYWSTEPMQLYFVNVPTRTGDAWVFPVGLNDALWFTFKNPKLIIHQMQSVGEALNAAISQKYGTVLLFDDEGKVTEKREDVLKLQ